MLYRKFSVYLKKWYDSKNKRALLVDGARQIGKTTLIREFGNTYYKDNFIEINFITSPSSMEIFKGDLDAGSIINKIALFTRKELIPHKSLIFFDEVQECPEVRTAIKFLVDDGRYDYIESGSLLGINYSKIKSYSVGYEEIQTMYPMDFEEFALANGVSEQLILKLKESFYHKQPVDEFVHKQMLKLFSLYIIIGGMPAAVNDYVNHKDLLMVLNTQKAISDLYKKDIAKYDTKTGRTINIYNAIPAELNEKNRRFVLSDIAPTARMERYETGFNWLTDSGVALPCYNVSEPKQPLAINQKRNVFKLFLNDSGLLCNMCSNDIQYQIINDNYDINCGSILENVMAINLKSNGFPLYYYDSLKIGEIDFIIEQNSKIIPIEIKSGNDFKKHNALDNLIMNKEFNIEEAIVFSKGNLEKIGKVSYYPLYMIMFLQKETKLKDISLDFDFSNLK